MRILSLSTLYPSVAQPNFGRFVELSLDAAEAGEAVEIVRISPNGLPPWPSGYVLPRYRGFAALPEIDNWRGSRIYRPRFTLLPGIWPARNARAIVNAVLPLARRLHAKKPFDLVDAQFFWPDGPAAMRIAEALDLPFSIKARGADIHYWSKVRGCQNQITTAAQQATGLLAVSDAIKADIAALGADPDKIRVHHTGIDRVFFHVSEAPRADLRNRIAIPNDGPLLVSVGALIPRKGQALAIEAVATLQGARLVLIGEGPDQSMLEAKALELGIADRVHFLGSRPHRDIARYLQAADVAVLPSASEGIANAWIEALACGTPLVITDVGGAREVMRDAAAGQIVHRTATAISDATRELLANPPPRSTVAANVADFSWEANGAALVAHWRGMVG